MVTIEHHHYHHHNHHHVAIKELGHMLTSSGLTHLEVWSSLVTSTFWDVVFLSVCVICYVAFDLYVSIFSCSPVVCLKLGLYLILDHPTSIFGK
jgi:hypothetical protein